MEVNPTTLTAEQLDRLLDTPVGEGEYKRELLRERARRFQPGIITCVIPDSEA